MGRASPPEHFYVFAGALWRGIVFLLLILGEFAALDALTGNVRDANPGPVGGA